MTSNTQVPNELVIRELGRQSYTPVWEAMSAFTDARGDDTPDEFWFVEHDPVFTQGQAGKAEHVLAPGDIPVVQVDRGGQVTYHGPGQQVVYVLIDLRRKKMGVRELVSALENAIVETCAAFGLAAAPRADAPGVYVVGGDFDAAKICSLGLRIRKGCSFHGLAFNLHMDLEPFFRINPCGYQGLQMSMLSQFAPQLAGPQALTTVAPILAKSLMKQLGYTAARAATGMPVVVANL